MRHATSAIDGAAGIHNMSTFDSLTWALEEWFDAPLYDLPDTLRQRVKLEFFPMPWDELSADQRRSVALQLDYQDDPTTEQDQKFWWDFFEKVGRLEKQRAHWEVVTTPTAAELALKEARLAELDQELARMDAQMRLARGDYCPERKPILATDSASLAEPTPTIQYVAYPKVMHQLRTRLGATPEELATWIWLGPEKGGIAAYRNANELDPPPRFFYAIGSGSQDYISPLMGCWFSSKDIDDFVPADRYINGAKLIERWSQRPGIHAVAFIHAKIAESRLLDIHPIYGGTRGTFPEHANWPPLESGLFALSQVEQIEAGDFGDTDEPAGLEKTEAGDLIAKPHQVVMGSPEWRTQTAKAAANARHDQPGGSRDRQRQIREIWASGKYTSRDLCAEQECAALTMSISAARRALINTPEPSRC